MYPVVLALGCLAGLVWLAMRRAPSTEADGSAFEAALLAIGLGLLGARLGHAAVHLPASLARPFEVLWVWEGGLSGPGAMIGAAAGVGAYAALRRRGFRPVADALVVPGLIAAVAAWAGCTLEGCVYGVNVVAGPLTPSIPDVFGVFAPRWPTAPVGLLASGLLLSAAILVEERPSVPGRRAALGLGGVGLISFGLSFSRADPALLVAGIRVDAVAAALVVLLALVVFVAARTPVPREVSSLKPFTLALAQIDVRLGDPAANLDVHLETMARARRQGADLVVFPELSLTGYMVKDLAGGGAHPGRLR